MIWENSTGGSVVRPPYSVPSRDEISRYEVVRRVLVCFKHDGTLCPLGDLGGRLWRLHRPNTRTANGALGVRGLIARHEEWLDCEAFVPQEWASHRRPRPPEARLTRTPAL